MAGCKWRGVSRVRERGELRHAAGIKRSKRGKQTLHLGMFATGAPPCGSQMPLGCMSLSRRCWQHAVDVPQLRGGSC